MGKVSIIVPVYNVEKYIRKCIDSILGQTYEDIELIIVNDGSKQAEDAIIQEYLARDNTHRIKYIKKEKNEGLFKARVTGVKAATGEYIEFVDSDDYIDKDFVRELVYQIEKDDADIAYSTTVICSPEGKKSVYSLMDSVFNLFPIYGIGARDLFFKQEGTAYFWHTMWNKIYRKSLWDKCMPFFEKIDRHLVMIEDICFSSILLYYARALTVNREATYFYCQHQEASTGFGEITYYAFSSKVSDVNYVFDCLDEFFSDKEEWIRKEIYKLRQMYARIWGASIDRVESKYRENCKKLINKLCSDPGKSTTFGDGYFYTINTEFDDNLLKIKDKIINGTEKYISFDVFETAVKRPFYNATDLFFLLDKNFENRFVCNSSFHTIRIEGENGCRSKLKELEDVTLDEIYDYISETYFIPKDICEEIKQLEIELEIYFNSRRNITYDLYRLALESGKEVIFTSDMYLTSDTIKRILSNCGYSDYKAVFVSSEYRKLKRTGKLYRKVIEELGCHPEDILHIGDNVISDHDKAEECGIHSILLPNTMNVLENKDCFDSKSAKVSGYGCMIQFIANHYFDNPYKVFHPLSRYGVDPYFMGYFPLGMNIAGQILKLEENIKRHNIKRVIFTSRDGYLIKQAYDDYQNIYGEKVKTEYRYTSRRAMLPLMLDGQADFLNLPIVCYQYTPSMICSLLDFCSAEVDEKLLKEHGWEPGKKFESLNDYHRFMHFFLKSLYSKIKHEEARRVIMEYWKDVNDDDLIYDMGYSAAIHNAIAKASRSKPVALFIHTDCDKHMHYMRTTGFDIECLMDTLPDISGLIREYFFSEQAPSCIAYAYEIGKVVPIFEEYEKRYTDLFPLHMMQYAALKFNHDFWVYFKDYIDYIDFRIDDILSPFETYIKELKKIDLKAFSASYFEDKVYGAADALNVRLFWLQQLSNFENKNSEDAARDLEELMNTLGKKKLAFWGTGKICKDLIEKNPNVHIDYFFDNSDEKNGTYMNGIKVIKPKNLQDYSDVLIVIACAMYLEIGAQLENCGLKQYKDYVTYMDVF